MDLICQLPKSALTAQTRELLEVPESGEDLCSIDFTISFIDDQTYLRYLEDTGLSDQTGGKLVGRAKIHGYDGNRVLSFDMLENRTELSLQMLPAEGAADHPPSQELSVLIADRLPAGFSAEEYSGLILFAPFSERDNYRPYAPDDIKPILTFRTEDPAQTAMEMKRLIQHSGITDEEYRLYNIAESQEGNRQVILIMNVFVYGFIILMALITVANVFNTISTNINLRRREFAMLRSVGLTDRGFQKMMNFECIFYGFKALFYGLPVSVVITWFIYKGVNAGVDTPFIFPWLSLGISAFAVFFIVFITMLYSIKKIQKENTVEALKNDML
jgi:putative ABC transport system permease protein